METDRLTDNEYGQLTGDGIRQFRDGLLEHYESQLTHLERHIEQVAEQNKMQVSQLREQFNIFRDHITAETELLAKRCEGAFEFMTAFAKKIANAGDEYRKEMVELYDSLNQTSKTGISEQQLEAVHQAAMQLKNI